MSSPEGKFNKMQNIFNLSDKTIELAEIIQDGLKESFEKIDLITQNNQNRVLKAFIDNKVSEPCLQGTTGYGYNDKGRETLESVFANVVGSEDAIVRTSFLSGTSTIAAALFGVLRPSDTMLCISGLPYDTLHGVIGIKETDGSLIDFGIKYEQIDLINEDFDYKKIEKRLKQSNVKMVYIQRSRGYSVREALSTKQIEQIVLLTKSINKDTIIAVDNCYCEFVQTKEPTHVGADLIFGSLIKNPGGGIARCGGYIAGRADLVEKCACRHSAPGIGKEVGATLDSNREMFLGLFNAPHAVGEAIKTAVFAAALFEKLGFEVFPKPEDERIDIVQTIIFNSPDALVSFCQGLQKGMPIDSFVTPYPWEMPGYDDEVVMACGSFTSGATIELSADGPIREPYAAWLQGGLNFHSAKTAILLAVESMINANVKMILDF